MQPRISVVRLATTPGLGEVPGSSVKTYHIAQDGNRDIERMKMELDQRCRKGLHHL